MCLFVPESIIHESVFMWVLKALPDFTKMDIGLDEKSSWDMRHLRCWISFEENVPMYAISLGDYVVLEKFAWPQFELFCFPPRPVIGRPCNFQHMSLVCRGFLQ